MIKQPVFAFLAFLLLLAVAWFIADRVKFLHTAERTKGTVTNVQSYNDRCGGGRRRSSYSCTKFRAYVEYTLPGNAKYNICISAGSKRGYDQPLSGASYHVGMPVNVVYNPGKPTEAYEDTMMGVWGTPIMIAVFQVITFIVSLTEPKRRRSVLD